MHELYNLDFESSVIGSLLIDSTLYGEVSAMVTAESFYFENNGAALRGIGALIEDRQPVDAFTLSDLLEKTNPTGAWLETLAMMARNVHSTANVTAYAKGVAEYDTLRRLNRAGQEVCRLCHDGTLTTQEKISRAQAATVDLIKIRDKRGPKVAKESLSEWLTHLERCVELGGGVTGLPTGFAQLDELTSGFHGGELVVLAARPSNGKTAFALNICQAVLNISKTVLVFSLEMQARELIGRMASNATSIFYGKVRGANLNDYDWRKVTEYVTHARGLPFFIDDQGGLHIADIMARSRAIATKQKIDLVVVDYIQLAQAEGENETTRIGRVSTGLKNLAKELDCPVLALSQLNREIEKRPEATPRNSDLRGSGQIEQDADTIMFLQPRDELHTELILGKNRSGRKDSVWLEPRLEFMRFLPGSPFIAPPVEPKKYKRGME